LTTSGSEREVPCDAQPRFQRRAGSNGNRASSEPAITSLEFEGTALAACAGTAGKPKIAPATDACPCGKRGGATNRRLARGFAGRKAEITADQVSARANSDAHPASGSLGRSARMQRDRPRGAPCDARSDLYSPARAVTISAAQPKVTTVRGCANTTEQFHVTATRASRACKNPDGAARAARTGTEQQCPCNIACAGSVTGLHSHIASRSTYSSARGELQGTAGATIRIARGNSNGTAVACRAVASG